MKRRRYLLWLILLSCVSFLRAALVDVNYAQQVAANFFYSRSGQQVSNVSLYYVMLDNTPGVAPVGDTVLYVFNMGSQGFVIVPAEDKAPPVLAYGTTGAFVSQNMPAQVQWQMNKYQAQISAVRHNTATPNPNTTARWTAYYNNEIINSRSSGVAPLCATTWDQDEYYDADCPYEYYNGGQCVTGCVATAMAQIMKYWGYPNTGTGSYIYSDGIFGTQAAYFGLSTYLWSQMPDYIYTSNSYIANICYQCGVSVATQYNTSEFGGSAASVTIADAGTGNPCSQLAFTQYFRYDSVTIQGAKRANYDNADWLNLVENELDSARPVLYEGVDAGGAGGHAWVCDGYDENNYLHMNWGWGGLNNGYYSIDTLDPVTYDFIRNEEALIGIQPPPQAGPTALFTSNTTTPGICSPVNFIDQSKYNPTSWYWEFPGGTPVTSTLQNPSVYYSAAGTYNVTLTVTNANGSDSVQAVAYITVPAAMQPYFFTGFYAPGLPATGWELINPNNDITWADTTVTSTYLDNTYNTTGVYMNCFADTNVGTKDILLMPLINFSYRDSYYLFYNYSYAQYDTTGNRNDSLIIIYTIGCDPTVHRIAARGGPTLATIPGPVQTPFVPGYLQWSTDVVDLSFLAGNAAVRIGFESINGHGNNIYLDSAMVSTGSPGPPVANFSGAPTPVPAGVPVSFTDLSLFGPRTWQWSFPGATPSTSTDRSPTGIIYPKAGSYTVSLIVSNFAGADTAIKITYINVNAGSTGGCVTLSNIPDAGAGDSAVNLNPYPFVPDSVSIYSITDQFIAPAAGMSITSVSIYFNKALYASDADFTNIIVGCAPGSAPPDNADINSIIYVQPLYYDSIHTDGSPTIITFATPVKVVDTFYIGIQSYNGGDIFSGQTHDYHDVLGIVTDRLNSPNRNTCWVAEGGIWVPVTSINGPALSDYIFPTLCAPVTNIKPVADFQALPNLLTAGGAVSFKDLSYNSPASWSWSFPGGSPSTSTQQNPTGIVYNTPGTYSVSLTVTNTNGNNTETKTGYITVVSYPTGACDTLTNFSLQTLTLYQFYYGAYYVGFYYEGDADYQYLSAIERYTAPDSGMQVSGVGAYFGKVVCDNNYDVATLSVLADGVYGPGNLLASQEILLQDIVPNAMTTVNFTDPPTVSGKFFVGVSVYGTYPDTVTLYTSPVNSDATENGLFYTPNLAYGGGEWFPWYQGNILGTRAANLDPAIFPIVCSAYTASSQPPVAAFTSNDTVVCEGLAIFYTDQSTYAPTSWSWSFPGGQPNEAYQPNPVVRYNTPGVYPVTLTVSNSNGSNTITRQSYITVAAPPGLQASVTASCNGNDGAATITVINGYSPYQYAWSNYDTTASISNLVPGSYSLTVHDAANCIVADTINIMGGFTLQDSVTNVTGCYGNNNGGIVLNATGGSGGCMFAWNGGQTGSALDSLVAGNYNVLATDTVSGCRQSGNYAIEQPEQMSDFVTITPSQPGDSTGTALVAVSGGVPPYSIKWSNGASDTAIGGLPPGNYTVSITDADSCTLSSGFIITIATGLQQVGEDVRFEIYPNPNNGQFMVGISGNEQNSYSVQVFNALGEMIYDLEKGKLRTDNFFIDLSQAAAGTYFVRLLSINHNEIRKVTVLQ